MPLITTFSIVASNVLFSRSGSLLRRDHHPLSCQPLELFSKLHFVWACIYTWCPISLSPVLMIQFIKNGVSGNGWATSTCLALLLVGNIISFGQSQKHLSLSLAWGSVVGQTLLLLNLSGTGQRMLIYWVLNLQRVQFNCHLYGIYKLAPG